MPVPWNGDDPRDLPTIRQNLEQLLRQIVEEAPSRRLPTVALARQWHRRIFEGARLPVSYYAGEIRDDDPHFPHLIDYEVAVGTHRGIPARQVPGELARFEAAVQEAVARLDGVIRRGQTPQAADQLHSVLTLSALTHGEWVRIHPFANGNGRTARLWANWSALRYGLPPFVRLKPRPQGDAYAMAASELMRGEHRPMLTVFAELLEERLGTPR